VIHLAKVIGTILHDRWRILSELGRGGMGEVYLAEHIALGRKEAIKILKASLASDPQFVSRFRREARAVNRLRHPNIIAVYDFGQLEDKRFYLSMEYADGVSVYQALKATDHFDVPRALHVLGQLAYAVHHAHSRGVVHRDLKPDNLILVGGDEMLKVLDFGVAKIVASDFNESMALSNTNMVWGSPRYMSPERARGVGDDPRSDIYAIGVLAFELLVGAPPFEGTSDEVIRAHLKRQPDPPSMWLQLPSELDAIVVKCLAKNPDDRFQSAADLFAAFGKVPGYPTERVEARRRYVPVRRRPTTLEPSEQDYTNLRGALRQVAEALVDRFAATARGDRETDTQLVSGVARLRDNEQKLAGLEAAQDALEHEATAVRQTMREREQSLRFALAELQFAAQQADPPAGVEDKIRDLEERLENAIDGGDRLYELERDIVKTADARAASLETLIRAYDALERLVVEILPGYAGDPVIDPLAQRLAMVRHRRPPTGSDR